MDQTTINGTTIILREGDITQQTTDAIVNAANSTLMGGGGVDGAIHRAGGHIIKDECIKIIARIGKLDTGKAVITTGGNLTAKYVIHTVGPVWQNGTRNEARLLASAYLESLKLALTYKLNSISFPSISTGAYRYPLRNAAKIALTTIISYLTNNPTSLNEVSFVLYDSRTLDVYSEVLAEIISS
jgi:O-acetyl-ADP-ribose deacetylase (regulator of RNase III)